jgi:ATP-binding cassette, subfamily C (CFTR/MRP), member 1
LKFPGTIRSNLDPFSLYDDAQLWDALRRSFLVESSYGEAPAALPLEAEKHSEEDRVPKPPTTSRFNLDTVIESEGANLSVGERSLLSLARALVKDSKVVVLDEAT